MQHTAGIYGFFTALAQAARQQPGQCLGWGRQVRCANGATGGGAALPSGVSQLQTVVALSPTNAWVAGVINNSASQLLHWNGSKWSIVAGPTLPRGNTVTFTDLSASSASDIWAIGIGSNGSGSGPLFAHFNGTAWQQITSSADVQFFNNDYTTIAAHSSTDALVVGFNSITGSPAVDQWDGKSWNPVSFALPAGENLFSGNHGEGATFTPGGDAWIVGGIGGKLLFQGVATIYVLI